MAKLDTVILMRLLAARAATVTTPTIEWLWHGEETPDGDQDHVVKVGVTIRRRPDQQSGINRADMPQIADVVLTFVCEVSPERIGAGGDSAGQSAWSLAQLTSAVANGFGDAAMADAATTHQLDTGPADEDLPIGIDDQPDLVAGVVTINAVWMRRTGNDLATVP